MQSYLFPDVSKASAPRWAAVVMLAALLAGCSSGPEVAEEAAGLGSDDRNAVYAMGLNMAGQLERLNYTDEQIAIVRQAISDAALAVESGGDPDELTPADPDPEAYEKGLDLFKSVEPMRLTGDEMALLSEAIGDAKSGAPKIDLETYRPLIAGLANKRANAAADAERERSEAYLQQAAAEPGVKKTVSGLIYKDLTPGTGRIPTTQNQVRVHYRGTLVDGTEFDSSIGKQPYQAHITSLIPCWTEGIRMMKQGGKAQLVCPAELAYGESGLDPAVPPNAALIFEIELLQVI